MSHGGQDGRHRHQPQVVVAGRCHDHRHETGHQHDHPDGQQLVADPVRPGGEPASVGHVSRQGVVSLLEPPREVRAEFGQQGRLGAVRKLGLVEEGVEQDLLVVQQAAGLLQPD
jgi:hypothetical protein